LLVASFELGLALAALADALADCAGDDDDADCVAGGIDAFVSTPPPLGTRIPCRCDPDLPNAPVVAPAGRTAAPPADAFPDCGLLP
jgi:hypothetical protein